MAEVAVEAEAEAEGAEAEAEAAPLTNADELIKYYCIEKRFIIVIITNTYDYYIKRTLSCYAHLRDFAALARAHVLKLPVLR